MSKIIPYILTSFCAIFSFSTFSANLAFLYNTPAQYFNSQDWKLLEDAVDEALSKLPNGKIKKWHNPATSNSGSVKPLNFIKRYGTVCRDLQITNYAQHRKDQYVFMFCKFSTGWKIPSK